MSHHIIEWLHRYLSNPGIVRMRYVSLTLIFIHVARIHYLWMCYDDSRKKKNFLWPFLFNPLQYVSLYPSLATTTPRCHASFVICIVSYHKNEVTTSHWPYMLLLNNQPWFLWLWKFTEVMSLCCEAVPPSTQRMAFTRCCDVFSSNHPFLPSISTIHSALQWSTVQVFE